MAGHHGGISTTSHTTSDWHKNKKDSLQRRGQKSSKFMQQARASFKGGTGGRSPLLDKLLSPP